MRISGFLQMNVGPLFLLILGGLMMGIVTQTDRRDITTASVILSAMVLFLTGILLLVFSEKPSPDLNFVSLLHTRGVINLCRVAADLGIAGSACFLPALSTSHHEVMQFIPVTEYRGGALTGDSFVSGPGGAGILVPPNGKDLNEMLVRDHSLIIPQEKQALGTMVHEVLVEVLEVADALQLTWSDEGVLISIDEYRLSDGCRKIFLESPACCSMNPCPVCSFIACSIVEGTGRSIQVDRCGITGHKDQVQIRFSFLS